MPITIDDAERIANGFAADYPAACELLYRFYPTTAELYGHSANTVGLKGAYSPYEIEYQGHVYLGRVDVPLNNIDDADDFLVTLRHEVLGHYGANTFSPAEKRALLDGIIAAEKSQGMSLLWDEINRDYDNQPMDIRAEEVFALYCEGVRPDYHLDHEDVVARGQRSFEDTCVTRVRFMQVSDLDNIACVVVKF